MKIFLGLLALFITVATSAQTTDTIRIVSYNLLNFPNGRNDCGGSNVNIPDRYDSLRKVLQYARPDIFVACEVQEKQGADSVLTRSLNVFGQTNYAMANWVNNTSGANGLQNILFYNTDKLILQGQHEIYTGVRDINQYILYAIDPNLSNHFDTTFYEVFMCHLKAGNSNQNEQQRLEQVQVLRDYIDMRPADRHYFVCGDLNVYSSSEPAYQELTVGGINPLKDPINRPGNWNNNSSFADIHTQSTRSSGSFDCGSTGGLDDRFDQILVSANVLSGEDSVHYVTHSYTAIGNDANHFNGSINAGTNALFPDSVVNALFYISDHLPVYLETVVNYPLTNGLALYPQVTSVSCHDAADGSITITPNAGQAPYTYQWGTSAGNQLTATATGLEAGSHCVVVTDALGEVDDICVYIGQPAPITSMVFTAPEYGDCSGEAAVLAGGGLAPYTYSWNDPMSQTSSVAVGLCQGTYTCTITDANGCEKEAVVIIENLQALELEAIAALTVYPNPSSESMYIRNTGKYTIPKGTLELTGMDGRVVLSVPFSGIAPEENSRLEVAGLDDGMYFLVVNGKVLTRIQVNH